MRAKLRLWMNPETRPRDHGCNQTRKRCFSVNHPGQQHSADLFARLRCSVVPLPAHLASRSLKGKGKRTTTIIGGGAGGGALIGGLAGGGKGALIGAALGAGAGTAGAAYTGEKEIVLPAESALSFKLTEPVNLWLHLDGQPPSAKNKSRPSGGSSIAKFQQIGDLPASSTLTLPLSRCHRGVTMDGGTITHTSKGANIRAGLNRRFRKRRHRSSFYGTRISCCRKRSGISVCPFFIA